jgi:methylated-DNA-[protein]-cysteine S-methyltransferase
LNASDDTRAPRAVTAMTAATAIAATSATTTLPAQALHPPAPWQAQCRIATPLGEMLLVASAAGLAGAWYDGQRHHPGRLELPIDPAHPHLLAAAAALRRHAQTGDAGVLPPLAPTGTAWQREVWALLCAIPPGGVLRYGEIAARLGRPRAARAVGAAVGRNPLSVLVPCHRVLGAGGALTGYAGGLERKAALLRLEAGAADRSATASAPEGAARGAASHGIATGPATPAPGATPAMAALAAG